MPQDGPRAAVSRLKTGWHGLGRNWRRCCVNHGVANKRPLRNLDFAALFDEDERSKEYTLLFKNLHPYHRVTTQTATF